MNRFFIMWLFVAPSLTSGAQPLELYQQTKQAVYAEAIKDTFDIDVVLPANYAYTSNQVELPLIILFDSYNTYTFGHHLKTIDMLTYHGQMPDAVVLGIPFTVYNRLALTSKPKIDELESFVFDQLIPQFKKSHHATGPLLVFGHSRSAYSVGYFSMHRMLEMQAAGVFSGFFDDGFTLNDIKNTLAEKGNTAHPFSFYYSCGTNVEEEKPYCEDVQKLEAFFSSNLTPKHFNHHLLTNRYANHMTNYNMSVEAALLDYFGPYNSIMDSWIFGKIEASDAVSSSQLLQSLFADFNHLSDSLGATLQPGLAHFISIASAYLNTQPEKATVILEAGRNLYPGDYELHYYVADAYIKWGKTKYAKAIIRDALALLEEDTILSQEDNVEWKSAFIEVLDTIE